MLETLFLFVILMCLIYLSTRKKEETSRKLPLPPGSLGIPYIGETLHLAAQKVHFFKQRRADHGAIYKTHLFGKPCIRVTGNSNVRAIMGGESKIVQISYPTSIKKLLGKNSLIMAHGILHKSRKRQLSRFLGANFLRRHRIQFLTLIRQYIARWKSKPSVEIYAQCKILALDLASKYIVDMDLNLEQSVQFKTCYQHFTDNMFSIPIDFPGFSFHKAMEAKRELKKMLKEVTEHLDCMNISPSVLQAYGASYDGQTVDDGHLDAILELLWNASETLTSALFSVCYYLAVNPKVLTTLREDLEFRRSEMARGMVMIKYVDCVVKEALRTMPPVGGCYRKTIRSFELDGFTIPKDWTIIFGIRDTHEHDNIVDPMVFDPGRWTTRDAKKKIAFMPFGGGSRMCPGNNYALYVLELFTTELCETADWNLLTDHPQILRFPRPIPKEPLFASFHNLDEEYFL